MSLRPLYPGALSFDLGNWAAQNGDSYHVEIQADNRLCTWLVNQAARRQDLQYVIKLGKPPIKATLLKV